MAAVVEENVEVARGGLRQFGTEKEINRGWRAAYRHSGGDPTKVRMAAESILRCLRLSDECGTDLYPFMLLCNAVSARSAVPFGRLDVARIEGLQEARYASGRSEYQRCDGVITVVPAGQITFDGEIGMAHARRCFHRRGGVLALSLPTMQRL
ncbi:hypothetical protein [Burkholderia multivorans]|uniref:hypothetical protein n=1 Tax=Burkholderia multivorans TaxID=87883 RepID=UPI00128F541C|nr:hypothetical protein [Burkholderia multivorans]